MARPPRNDVDYFPYDIKEGKKMFYIEQKYKNDGYATWMKILVQLAKADYHYLNLNDEIQIMHLSSKCLVDEETLFNIINDLVRLKVFDKELWEESRIIFNQKFIDSVRDAYKKRNNDPISKEGLLTLLEGLGIWKPPKQKPIPCDNPQSKVKYSKEKNTTDSSAPQSDPEPILSIPLVHKNGNDKPQLYPIFQKDIDEWQESYPAIDASQMIRTIRQWNIDNPTRRKTKNGIRKHINSWLAREQDKGGKGFKSITGSKRSDKNLEVCKEFANGR